MEQKSDFTYGFETIQGRDCLVIEDLNLGNISVTNNIEKILEGIEHTTKADNLKNLLIVYKDSDNVWDGYDYIKKEFVYLFGKTLDSAIEKYIEYQFN